ncbi:MAG TPA: peptide chain release factor 3 [Clostridiaceae bacterium]|nr:peptide chain release factor 3 [Clostridiaceae bacterium]
MKQKSLTHEVERRRTFAIISHPDAGKTTITEKLLLYGGAIHEAGSVKARKASHHATSDWMEIEKQRGISVTSSIMQFEYDGYCVNILDTPGHQDFSEDTYRTLCAADAAVMLIDGAKGVEPQTIKLFHVCRMRGIPIFTFVNKMDRASLPPFDLLDQLEKVLNIDSFPINWPIGTDGDFKGVYNRQLKQVQRFISDGTHGSKQVNIELADINDPELTALIGAEHQQQICDEIELLDVVGEDFDMERVLDGELTPVFFGSAITNFGVEPFLRDFLKMAPPPGSKKVKEGTVKPTDEAFSAFVFKIQANMNPGHRDRMAFIRICSGHFKKGLEVTNVRDNKPVRLTQPQTFMAQDHRVLEEAFAGDIIGIFDPGVLRIGDSLYSGDKPIEFADIPRFSPEHFAKVQPKNSLKRKQFNKGMEQLAQEGAIQLYKRPDAGTESYMVGVVGVLQFDVLEHRLNNEYNVDILMQPENYRFARWISFTDRQLMEGEAPDDLNLTSTTLTVMDRHDLPVLLFESQWAMDWALERNEGLILSDINA